MAKHDLPANQWPELFGFLRQYIKSQQPLQREVSCMSVIKLLFLLTSKLHITIIIIIYKLADVFLNNVLWITVLTRVEHTPWHLKCHLVLEYVEKIFENPFFTLKEGCWSIPNAFVGSFFLDGYVSSEFHHWISQWAVKTSLPFTLPTFLQYIRGSRQ